MKRSRKLPTKKIAIWNVLILGIMEMDAYFGISRYACSLKGLPKKN